LGFGWWTREELEFLAKAFLLAPAIALVVIGVTPLSAFVPIYARVAFSTLATIAIVRLGLDIVSAATLPLAPDTAAIFFRSAAAAIVGVWLWLVWEKWRRTTPSQTSSIP